MVANDFQFYLFKLSSTILNIIFLFSFCLNQIFDFSLYDFITYLLRVNRCRKEHDSNKEYKNENCIKTLAIDFFYIESENVFDLFGYVDIF